MEAAKVREPDAGEQARGLRAASWEDLLNGLAANERDRARLYEFAAGLERPTLPRFRERCQEGQRRAAVCARVLSELVEELNGNPRREGPVGRLDVFRNLKMLELIALRGSAAPAVLELATVEALLAAEHQAKGSRQLVGRLVECVGDTRVRQALAVAHTRLEEAEGGMLRFISDARTEVFARRVWGGGA